MAYCKVVKSGNIYEVYQYSNLNICGTGGGNVGEHTEETKDENYWRTIKARRDNVRRLVCENFDVKESKFITLTFNDKCDFDIRSPLECDRAFYLFIKRLKYRMLKKHPLTALKYVAVLEFQDKYNRGAVHYHMICNLPFIKNKELQEIWGNGFVKINEIKHVDNIGAYVVKYMTKEKADERLKGCKGYLASNNLKRPVVICDWQSTHQHQDIEELLHYLEKEKPVYINHYTNEHNSTFYIQYNLKSEKVSKKDIKLAFLSDKMDELFGAGNWDLV